jgi:hypothetical protein
LTIAGPRHNGILLEDAMDHIDGRLMGEMSAKIYDRDPHNISTGRWIAQQNIIVDLIGDRVCGRSERCVEDVALLVIIQDKFRCRP